MQVAALSPVRRTDWRVNMKRNHSRSAFAGFAVATAALAIMNTAIAQQTAPAPDSAAQTAPREAAYTPLSFDETSMDRLGNTFFEERGVLPARQVQTGSETPGLRRSLPYQTQPARAVPRDHPERRDRHDEQEPENR